MSKYQSATARRKARALRLQIIGFIVASIGITIVGLAIQYIRLINL